MVASSRPDQQQRKKSFPAHGHHRWVIASLGEICNPSPGQGFLTAGGSWIPTACKKVEMIALKDNYRGSTDNYTFSEEISAVCSLNYPSGQEIKSKRERRALLSQQLYFYKPTARK